MARPKRVYPSKLHLYDKLHTVKVKMYAGMYITALHLIKETAQFFISIESWAFCCSTFKALKYGTKLNVDIPVIKNEKTINFLKLYAWHDWIERQLKDSDSDMAQAIKLLDKLFPEKKKEYFYELHSLIAAYCHGTFVRYKDDGSVDERNHDIEHRKYYIHKYKGMFNREGIKFPAEINKLNNIYLKTIKGKDEKAQKIAFDNYYKALNDYLYEHHNITDTFISIGENSIVCPYIFTHQCVKGSSYENAGDIYMVVTDDTVYFEIQRHF
jgi:hypothetical protein